MERSDRLTKPDKDGARARLSSLLWIGLRLMQGRRVTLTSGQCGRALSAYLSWFLTALTLRSVRDERWTWRIAVESVFCLVLGILATAVAIVGGDLGVATPVILFLFGVGGFFNVWSALSARSWIKGQTGTDDAEH